MKDVFKLIVFVLILLLPCACKQTEKIVYKTQYEKEYVDNIIYDSIFVDKYVSVSTKNDTVYADKYNTEYKYKFIKNTDTVTLYDTIVLHDKTNNNNKMNFFGENSDKVCLILWAIFLVYEILKIIIKKWLQK